MDVIRQAEQLIQRKDWSGLDALSRRLIETDENPAYGHYFKGLLARVRGQFVNAQQAFELALRIDRNCIEARVASAEILQRHGRHGDAIERLPKSQKFSPNIAKQIGDIYSRAGLHAEAAEPYQQAYESDPQSPTFQMNLAGNLSKTGDLKKARDIYSQLLRTFPDHQRMHYDLAKLSRATDEQHYDQMQALLSGLQTADDKNIFLLFALGKTAEDLGHSHDAFAYYNRGNNAAANIARNRGYKVEDDLAIFSAMETNFIAANLQGHRAVSTENSTPIFIVGLPRSGTTLTEKILTGHPSVESMDESFFLENAIKSYCGLAPNQSLTPMHIEKMANSKDTAQIIEGYLTQSAYRRTGRPFFIEKYPLNFQYVGLIARHLPNAKFVCLQRHPMDVCFALYKQPHFKFALELESAARFYAAFEKLRVHWKSELGSRIHFLPYENLVRRPAETIRAVMDYLGASYSDDLLNFHQRQDVSASASSTQIREKLYTRSVERWRTYESELAPLKAMLEREGINLSLAE